MSGVATVSALVLLFLGRMEGAGLALVAAFGLLAFHGPFQGLEAGALREMFADDDTSKLDPLLVAGFAAAFVGLYLVIKLQIAAASTAFGFAATALGVSKGTNYGVRKAQLTKDKGPKSEEKPETKQASPPKELADQMPRAEK